MAPKLKSLFFLSAALATAAYGQETRTLAEERLAGIVEREQALYADYERDPDSFSQGDLEAAVAALLIDYSNYLRDHPDDVPALILYGKLLRRADEDERAMEAFLRADRLDPSIAVVKQQIANGLAERGEYAGAFAYLLQAVDLAPETAVYHYQLGEMLSVYRDALIAAEVLDADGWDRQVLEAFGRAAALEPGNFDLRMREGEAYYDLFTPRWEAALEVWNGLRKTAATGLRRQVVDLHRARVLAELGRNREAEELLATVTEPDLAHSRGIVRERINETGRPDAE